MNTNHFTDKAQTRSQAQREIPGVVIRAGNHLFRMGDTLEGVYQINSGAIKIYRTTENGEEQILGFAMPGELIGLDAMADGTSQSSAIALDTCNTSLVPYKTMTQPDQKFDYQSFIHQIGATINREKDHMLVLSQRTADRKISWFLTEFSDNLASRGYCPTELTLPMSRTDLATFLGLAVETVCRELASLCDRGLITKNRRAISITDLNQLKRIARGESVEHPAPQTDRAA